MRPIEAEKRTDIKTDASEMCVVQPTVRVRISVETTPITRPEKPPMKLITRASTRN